MTENVYVFDTYALVEILNANPNYKPYVQTKMIINELIFAEFCYKLLRERVENAQEYINEVMPAIVRANADIIKEAMKWRAENKTKKLSMTDCISYTLAKRLGIKFLTGDKEFEHAEHVEFVK